MDIYALIIPATLLLLILEILYDYFKKDSQLYSFQDTISNLGTGIGNQCINIAVLFFIVDKFYPWVQQFAPWQVESTWYNILLLLVISDFVFYWFHRTGHKVNVFWAAHMPHHSSEEFNLSVAMRSSFTQRTFQFLFFDWVLVLMGFPPNMVYMVAGIHLFIAFWHHTKIIGDMGWFQKVFVAPAHHRVHHGVNLQYLDKNFSEFLIIWDKMFGTYEPEVEEVCYGLTHPPRTWDPIYINIQFWKQLFDDAIAAPHFIDKIKIWFMPTGWRPRGIEPYPPLAEIAYTKKEQTKFYCKQFKGLKPYLILQVIMAIPFLYLIIGLKLGDQLGITNLHRIIMSSGIFIMIIAWGGMTEAKKWSNFLEVFRLLFMGIVIIVVLYSLQHIEIMSWVSILVSLFVGASILYVSFRFRQANLEGEAFKLKELA
jgi:alkylglycerol monooxygenase